MNKHVINILWVVGLIIIFVILQRYSAKDSARQWWRTEREENAKRLFGDAWQETL